ADAINGTTDATTSYSYDAVGRVTRITQQGDKARDKRVDLAYNGIGQFTEIDRYADLAGARRAISTTYLYDQLNRLVDLSHRDATAKAVASYRFDYDPAGRIDQIIDANGTTNYSYDAADQLLSADHTDPSRPDESYSYDASGNRVELGGRGNVAGN